MLEKKRKFEQVFDEGPRKGGDAQPHHTHRTTETEKRTASGGYNDPFELEGEIEEFLRKNTHGKKFVRSALDAANEIRSIILNAKESGYLSIDQATQILKEKNVFLPLQSYQDSRTFPAVPEVAFLRPSRVEIGGSLLHNTIIRTSTDEACLVDIILEIPSGLFSKKDHLDYGYYQKRAFYMAYTAAILKDHGYADDCLHFESLDGNGFLPVLLVTYPKNQPVFRLVPSISPEVFPLHSLSASYCSLRSYGERSTMRYNESIIDDASRLETVDLLRKRSTSLDRFRNAYILGSYWLLKHNRSSCILKGGFGQSEWALLQDFIVKRESKLDQSSSSQAISGFQLFNKVLEFLATSNLTLQSDTDGTAKKTIQHDADLPILVVTQTKLNILHKMSGWSYDALRLEALAVLQPVHNSLFQRFHHIFGEHSFAGWNIPDLIVRFPLDAAAYQLLSDRNDHDVKTWNDSWLQTKILYKILTKALGDRFCKMTFSFPNTPARAVGNIPEENTLRYYKEAYIDLHLNLDGRNSRRSIDQGPNIEDARNATCFREFWQDKSELRRFKDGRVMETVSWDDNLAIVPQIISFIYERKIVPILKLLTPTFYGPLADELIPGLKPTASTLVNFEDLMSEYAKVSKIIRDAKDIPLLSKAIRGTSPNLRFASIESPNSLSTKPKESTIITIELEDSLRWPSDSKQRRRSEAAILLRFRMELLASPTITSAEIKLCHRSEEEEHILPCLQLTTGKQNIFQLYLEESRTDSSVIYSRKESSSLTGFTYCRKDHEDSVVCSKHVDRILRLSRKHEYFSPVMRLTKLWFQRHILLPYFGHEFIEICCAWCFSQPIAHLVPGSTYGGFRRVIELIASWNWQSNPLLVDLANLSDDTYRKRAILEHQTQRQRVSDKKTVILFAACIEETGLSWTRTEVPMIVALRMTTLARAACRAMKDISCDMKYLFSTSYNSFDFVLETRKPYKDSTTSYKSYKNLSDNCSGKPWNPCDGSFLKDLELHFGDNILFFPFSEQQSVFCLWKPTENSHSSTSHFIPILGTLPVRKNASESIYNKSALLSALKRFVGSGTHDIRIRQY